MFLITGTRGYNPSYFNSLSDNLMRGSTHPYVLQIFYAIYAVLVYLRQTLSELPPLSLQSLSLHPHVSPFIYLLNWTVLEIAQCHVTRMNCNCWCTLCIFESHFPSFWECFLSRHGPKNVSFKHSFSGSSGWAPEPFSVSECKWRLAV